MLVQMIYSHISFPAKGRDPEGRGHPKGAPSPAAAGVHRHLSRNKSLDEKNQGIVGARGIGAAFGRQWLFFFTIDCFPSSCFSSE
jgi:hypothetical protein